MALTGGSCFRPRRPAVPVVPRSPPPDRTALPPRMPTVLDQGSSRYGSATRAIHWSGLRMQQAFGPGGIGFHYKMSLSRQGKDIKRPAMCGTAGLKIRQHHLRLVLGAAATKTGCHGNILLAIRAERDRESLYRRGQARLPQGFSVFTSIARNRRSKSPTKATLPAVESSAVRNGARC